jgi:hypothetical protein
MCNRPSGNRCAVRRKERRKQFRHSVRHLHIALTGPRDRQEGIFHPPVAYFVVGGFILWDVAFDYDHLGMGAAGLQPTLLRLSVSF